MAWVTHALLLPTLPIIQINQKLKVEIICVFFHVGDPTSGQLSYLLSCCQKIIQMKMTIELAGRKGTNLILLAIPW